MKFAQFPDSNARQLLRDFRFRWDPVKRVWWKQYDDAEQVGRQWAQVRTTL